MNKIKFIIPFFVVFLFFQLNGCDELNSIPLNIPYTYTFNDKTGSDVTFDSDVRCLSSESDTYQEYQDKIQSLTFVEAAYRTTYNSNPSVQGNLSATIYNGQGQELAHVQINNVKPEDYKTHPWVLPINQTEIQAINNLLKNSTCLRVVVGITSMNGTTTISGAVDVVFRADTNI
ncbi:MAG: hypothetical protein P8Z35_04205 [Ignavibacteriaceae bacterium]